MSTPMRCLVAFASAVVVDAVLASWVSAVSEHQEVAAGVLSMVCAVASLLGLGQALKGRWPAAAWVLGYGVGSWLAVARS